MKEETVTGRSVDLRPIRMPKAVRPLEPRERDELRALYESLGMRELARRSGLSATALSRAMAGIGVLPASREVLRRVIREEAAPRSAA